MKKKLWITLKIIKNDLQVLNFLSLKAKVFCTCKLFQRCLIVQVINYYFAEWITQYIVLKSEFRYKVIL